MTNKKILIIDDEYVTTHILTQKIEKRGYKVDVVNDAKTLLNDITKLSEYGVVLLDIIMPQYSGVDLLIEIRKHYNQNILPIIMMTAQSSVEDIVNALDLGANDYVTKPVNLDILISRISTQYKIVKLNREQEIRRQVEAINAMVATYHHEINNPLAIASGALEILKTGPKDKLLFDRIENSLERIATIVGKIEQINDESPIQLEEYMNGSNILKFDD